MGVSILVTQVGSVDFDGVYTKTPKASPESVKITGLGSDNDVIDGTKLKTNGGFLGLFGSQVLMGYAGDSSFKLKPGVNNVTIEGTSFENEKKALAYLESRLNPDPLNKVQIEDTRNYAVSSEIYLWSKGGRPGDKLHKIQIQVD